jgi:aryl-alcohol dehydrogenase-like predicted oxidoreductase
MRTMSISSQPRVLGKTGLNVGRIGVASTYGAPAAAFEEAFEHGVNYFYWGSLRRDGMRDAIRHLAPQRRDDLVVVVQSYSRWGFWLVRSVQHALRRLRLDYADVLLLGLHDRPPGRRIMDAAERLRDRGLVRHLALSAHRRRTFAEVLDDAAFDIWHVRYNAVHRRAESEVFAVLEARDAAVRPGLVSFTATRWRHLLDPARTPAGERTPTATDCYRFVLAHPTVDLVMSAPANTEQMRMALAALDQGPMAEAELAWMRRVGDHIYRTKRPPLAFRQRR